MKFKLVKPDVSYKDKAYDFLDECNHYESAIHGGGSIRKYLKEFTYEEWLDRIEYNSHIEKTDDRVPDETYFLVNQDDNIIGVINIRLGLNDMLRDLGGHIGYTIRPTERGKGYNKINLYLGLKRLHEVGEKEALLDCEVDNIASSSTMKALGGKLVKTKNTEKYGMVEDYIIDIDEALNKYGELYEQYVIDDQFHMVIKK